MANTYEWCGMKFDTDSRILKYKGDEFGFDEITDIGMTIKGKHVLTRRSGGTITIKTRNIKNRS